MGLSGSPCGRGWIAGAGPAAGHRVEAIFRWTPVRGMEGRSFPVCFTGGDALGIVTLPQVSSPSHRRPPSGHSLCIVALAQASSPSSPSLRSRSRHRRPWSDIEAQPCPLATTARPLEAEPGLHLRSLTHWSGRAKTEPVRESQGGAKTLTCEGEESEDGARPPSSLSPSLVRGY